LYKFYLDSEICIWNHPANPVRSPAHPDLTRAGRRKTDGNFHANAVAEISEETYGRRTEIHIRESSASGLIAFGLTTVILSLINAGILPKGGEPVVLPLAFAFGGLTQMIAGVMEFRTGNTFGTVAF